MAARKGGSVCDLPPHMPLISVVTATWNCASTLPDCLRSASEQSYRNFEHVVVDGGSTDGTLGVLNAHSGQIAQMVSERDRGIYDALNKGIAMSRGEVIGFLHADDLYAGPAALESIAAAFDDPSISAVYGDLVYVQKDDTSKVVRRWKGKAATRRDLRLGWMPAHPTLYVRREWYDRIGGFDTTYRISADYLSVLQLFSAQGFRARYVPETLVTMRLGGASNRSLQSITRKSKEDWRALRSCGFNPLQSATSLLFKNLSKVQQFV